MPVILRGDAERVSHEGCRLETSLSRAETDMLQLKPPPVVWRRRSPDAQELRTADPADSGPATSEADPSGPPTRNVLVLASRFPPVASVGAIRIRKFVKYLPDFGWKPVVITGAMRTARPGAQEVRRAVDPASLADLPPDITIHRLSPVPDNWPGLLARRLSRWLSAVTRVAGLSESWWNARLKWRLQRLHDRFTFPDRGIWRLPSAVRAAIALHRQHRFDAIFSSGMPFSDHLIALAVSIIIRRPWLADFRDPWVEYIHWNQWRGACGRFLTRRCESAVIRRAASVISVNDHMTRRFEHRYKSCKSGKFRTIGNGFDPADFPRTRSVKPAAHFRLLYAGSLYQSRSPEAVLAAFRAFIQSTPGSEGRAVLEFAGRAGPFLSDLERPADKGTIRYLGMLPHQEAMSRMAAADVNLIILPDLPGGEGDTTAKLYECLGSGRAVLAVVPPNGAAASELSRYDGVWLCAPRDVASITRAISEMYGLWLAGRLEPARSAEALSSITRRGQARQLAEVLNSAIGAKNCVKEMAS